MAGTFEPEQQQTLEIGEDTEFVLNGASLVTLAFPAPDLAIPGQPAHRSVSPAHAGGHARTQHRARYQHEAPIELPGALNVPKQDRKQAAEP